MIHVTLINKSWMSLVTRMDESWMGHATDTNQWVMSSTTVSCRAYERVTALTWPGQVAYMYRSSHTHESATEHFTSSLLPMNESSHTYEWVISHTWTSQVKHKNESQGTLGRFSLQSGVPCIWVQCECCIWNCFSASLFPHSQFFLYAIKNISNERHIHMRGMPRSNSWHASFICVTCLTHKSDMPHS